MGLGSSGRNVRATGCRVDDLGTKWGGGWWGQLSRRQRHSVRRQVQHWIVLNCTRVPPRSGRHGLAAGTWAPVTPGERPSTKTNWNWITALPAVQATLCTDLHGPVQPEDNLAQPGPTSNVLYVLPGPTQTRISSVLLGPTQTRIS
jgi:hypothetical protein